MNLSARFSEAFSYAADLHAAQQRKLSGGPYLSHLMAVSAIVLEHGGDEDEAIAALLHDAAEDQGGEATLAEIRRRFGARVADIIEACTDTMESPKPPWRERKEAYIARLRDILTEKVTGTVCRNGPSGALHKRCLSPFPASVRLVTAADKLHNARAILREYRRLGESLWSHFRGGRDGTLWYYRTVVETLKLSSVTPLVEELDCVVTELERLTGG